ncbi:MAG: polysaccharide deacetylase family protein [Clostridia bacterium]|nr:polysaccharide deacetylase family protein [Clostridia bacterium]
MMKKLIGCIAALTLAAVVIGTAVYFTSGGLSPAKKMMKEHPYAFQTGKSLGSEKQDQFVEDKTGIVYTAYPKTKNTVTDQTVEGFLEEARQQFGTFMAEHTAKEEETIPQLIFDYTTEQKEGYTALTCFYEITALNEKGEGTPAISDTMTYYIGEDNAILDLDGVLGENSEKKLNLMLKASDKTTEDLECFTVDGDVLTLRWPDGEKEFSVQAVERAGLIDPTKPMIALTFDDGPGKYSRQFADLLAEYGGHGTFFVLGVNVPTFSESLKYVYEMGNEIGSHTQSHKNLNKLSESGIRAEIDDAANAIYEAIGAYPTVIRTPFGNANNTVMSIINGPMIKWSVDTLDWKTRNAEAVKNEILQNTKDGDIVLLHEIYESSYEGLKLALKDLSAKGYQFVTVSELMRYRGVEPEAKHYYSCYPE